MAKEQVQRVAPLKLKLSLSSSLAPSTPTPHAAPSTPDVSSRKTKAPSNGSSAAGPSTPSAMPNVVKLKAVKREQPEAGPSTPIPRAAPASAAGGTPSSHTPAPAKASAKKSAAKTKTPKAKPAPKPKGKLAATSTAVRPSAIPSRLLSSGPTTPRSSTTALPSATPELDSDAVVEPTPFATPVKSEPLDDDEDPLSLPLSPSAMEISTPAQPADGGDGLPLQFATPEPRGRQPVKWQRIKKPLRELLNKMLAELRRRDEYDLFGGPVNPEDFPDYLDIVGGEDNMMDLGTMQQKVDDGDYRNMDGFEADVRKLADAAMRFNPMGTVPHNAAKKLLGHGIKLVERYRSTVKTPSPSPERQASARETPVRAHSTFSGREGTVPLSAADLPPRLRIPTEMLAYPANSLTALAVGWNLTGGRRVYAKRQIRGREKFVGKWRNWALDGTRDIAEMDDMDQWFEAHKRSADETSLHKPDWLKIRKEADWWDLDLGGSTGQPPIPFTPYPTPPALRHRTLGVTDWALFPEIDAETRILASRGKVSDHMALSQQLRSDKPIKDRPVDKAQPFVNTFDGHLDIQPKEVLSEAMFGDVTGEAYARSVRAFVEGATTFARDHDGDTKPDVHAAADDAMILSDWVDDNWRGGAMQPRPVVRTRQVLEDLYDASDSTDTGPERFERQKAALRIAEEQYARQALKYMTRPTNELDILPLLKDPSEFLYPGIGGRASVANGMAWVCQEIPRLNDKVKAVRAASASHGVGKRKRDADKDEAAGLNTNDAAEGGSVTERGDHVEPGSKKAKIETSTADAITSTASLPPAPHSTSTPEPAEAAPISAVKVETTEPASGRQPAAPADPEDSDFKQLRLELSALCKFYPLHSLKKMSRADAERLLPANVRGLMSKKD